MEKLLIEYRNSGALLKDAKAINESACAARNYERKMMP